MIILLELLEPRKWRVRCVFKFCSSKQNGYRKTTSARKRVNENIRQCRIIISKHFLIVYKRNCREKKQRVSIPLYQFNANYVTGRHSMWKKSFIDFSDEILRQPPRMREWIIFIGRQNLLDLIFNPIWLPYPSLCTEMTRFTSV